MTTPRIIEYIQSLRDPLGRQMTELGTSQLIIPVWPAGAVLTAEVRPAAETYAWIGYRVQWSPAMVPDAFIGSVYHSGTFLFSGTMSAAVLNEGVWGYFVVTSAASIRYWAQNVTALNQYDEVIGSFCSIPSKEDMDHVQKKLDDLAISGWGDLRDEALAVLRAIKQTPEGGL